MKITARITPADCPARVPLSNAPPGIWGSLRTGRRDVLQLIPEIATRAPIISGRTAERWHMVMSPERCGGSCATMSGTIRNRW